MSTFYLLRHGAKEAVMGNPPLSELGVKQAEVLAKFLKNHSIIALYSSPLLRTLQTAQIVAKVLGLPVVTDERLKERMNWGDKAGESFEEFLAEWEKASNDRKYQPTHGDSALNTGKRIENFLRDIGKDIPDGNVVVVTHGGAIGDFLKNIFTNLPLESSQTGATYVKLIECSITTVALQDENFILKDIGNTNHLSEPLM